MCASLFDDHFPNWTKNLPTRTVFLFLYNFYAHCSQQTWNLIVTQKQIYCFLTHVIT